MNSQELKIQPLFSKPLGFTKIHLTEEFIDWVKKNGYHKEVDPSESNGAASTNQEPVKVDGIDVASL